MQLKMRRPQKQITDTPSFGRSPRNSLVELDVLAVTSSPARGSSYDESGDVSNKYSDCDERGWKRNSASTNS